MISETIPTALDGERIDRVVAMLSGCTRAEAATAVADGTVSISGKVVTKPSTRVRTDQVVELVGDPHIEEPLPEPDPSVEFTVLHEDDDVIVIDKPAGLIVHPGAGHKGTTLVNGLLARFPDVSGVGEAHRPGIVHRLDKGTSGLMVVARTEDAYHELVDQLMHASEPIALPEADARTTAPPEPPPPPIAAGYEVPADAWPLARCDQRLTVRLGVL